MARLCLDHILMKILSNAHVYTFDPLRPKASVLLVDYGRITAAGGEDLLTGFDKAVVEDMGGRVILPGLTDAHLHLQEYALSRQGVQCEGLGKEECLEQVAGRLRQTPQGEWIYGHGWDQNEWGGGWPTAAELDRVASDRPVYLTARSLHAVWANSLALQLAGIGENTPDPTAGRLQRDERGQPTGIFFDDAIKLVKQALPEPRPEVLSESFRRVLPELWQLGLTGVHDFDKRTCFMALQQLHERGELKFRVVKSIPLEMLRLAVGMGLRTGFGDDSLRIGPVKVFADGALGTHTAAMLDPYVDDLQNRGILLLTGDELYEIGCQVVANGLSLAVHAIGDRAVREVLDGFARLRDYEKEQGLTFLRHRIEHVQVLHPQDASRLAELNLIASMQPVHAVSDMDVAKGCWGSRTDLSYAWKTQLQQGAHLAFGSDAPVESPNPFWGVHAAVTRQRMDGSPGPDGWIPQQRLTVQEALEGFTLGPAYAAGVEDHIGRLAAGYLADLTVLDRDPFKCEPSELRSLLPEATMVGGEWVWRS